MNDSQMKIDTYDEYGFAPIHYAAKFGCLKTLNKLLQHHASVLVDEFMYERFKLLGMNITCMHLSA